MRSPYQLAILYAAIACALVHAEEQYGLDAFRITANAPVTVTLGHPGPVREPAYKPAAGDWMPLQAQQQDGAVSFAMPADAIGDTLVLLTRPDWLTLPDADAPRIMQAIIDGATVTPEGTEIACGAVAAPPVVQLRVVDEKNPILTSRVRATINGLPIDEFGGKAELTASDNGKDLLVSISPGELPEAAYTIEVAAPDASPSRNTLLVSVRFSTAPLLRNGGFEAVSSDGKPEHWSVGSWGGSDPGDYKMSVAEGQGRSGNALCMQGISGRINMVVGQSVDMVAGKTYVLSGYAKGDGVGYASLVAADTAGGKQQYDNTGRTSASTDWQPFAWELSPQPNKKGYTLYLRNAAVGTVFFDDVRLDVKP